MVVFNRMVLCAVLFVPLIFVGTASAQTTYTATAISAGPLSGGVSNARFEVFPSGGGGTRYGNALVPVSKSSLGKMTVGAMSRHPGIHLAIMAYVALHENWEWDPLEHRFKSPGTEPGDGQYGFHTFRIAQHAEVYSNPSSACTNPGVNWTPGYEPNGGYTILSWPQTQGSSTTGNRCAHNGPGFYTNLVVTLNAPEDYPFPGETGQEIPHDIVGERLEQAPESITNQITNNVINQNNTTIQNEWNELHLTRVNIETSFENETPDGQWTQTPGAGDTTINNTFSMEFPVFCDWAGVVCSFIEWVQGDSEPPEDVELPTEETGEVWDEWDSGIPSSGSCPAPHTTEFMGNAISIPFDDFCYGLSTYFRPIFIALAMFAAGFILVGARQ